MDTRESSLAGERWMSHVFECRSDSQVKLNVRACLIFATKIRRIDSRGDRCRHHAMFVFWHRRLLSIDVSTDRLYWSESPVIRTIPSALWRSRERLMSNREPFINEWHKILTNLPLAYKTKIHFTRKSRLRRWASDGFLFVLLLSSRFSSFLFRVRERKRAKQNEREKESTFALALAGPMHRRSVKALCCTDR